MFPPRKIPKRLKISTKYFYQIKVDGNVLLVGLNIEDVEKLEKLNNLKVNVFELNEGKAPTQLYISAKRRVFESIIPKHFTKTTKKEFFLEGKFPMELWVQTHRGSLNLLLWKSMRNVVILNMGTSLKRSMKSIFKIAKKTVLLGSQSVLIFLNQKVTPVFRGK